MRIVIIAIIITLLLLIIIIVILIIIITMTVHRIKLYICYIEDDYMISLGIYYDNTPLKHCCLFYGVSTEILDLHFWQWVTAGYVCLRWKAEKTKGKEQRQQD